MRGLYNDLGSNYGHIAAKKLQTAARSLTQKLQLRQEPQPHRVKAQGAGGKGNDLKQTVFN
jgi:hypothetical protein